MEVSGPAPVSLGRSTEGCRFWCARNLLCKRHGFIFVALLFFAQMPAGQPNENIFQAGLTCGEVLQLASLLRHRLQQCWNCQMRLLHTESDHAIILSNGLNTGQGTPNIEPGAVSAPTRLCVHGKLYYVMTTEPLDQVGGRTLGNNLTMVHDGQPIAQALSLIHVMRGQQDRAARTLEFSNDVPKLPAALRIETRGGLVEKKNLWIAYQRRSNRQTLPLPPRKLSHPRVRFFRKLQLFEHFIGRTRLAIETGKQFHGFTHRKLFGKPGLLQGNSQPLPHFAGILPPGVAKNGYVSRRWLQQALKDFNGGSFPCSVWTKQTEAFAALNLEVQAAHGLELTVVGLPQVATLDSGSHAGILTKLFAGGLSILFVLLKWCIAESCPAFFGYAHSKA